MSERAPDSLRASFAGEGRRLRYHAGPVAADRRRDHQGAGHYGVLVVHDQHLTDETQLAL